MPQKHPKSSHQDPKSEEEIKKIAEEAEKLEKEPEIDNPDDNKDPELNPEEEKELEEEKEPEPEIEEEKPEEGPEEEKQVIDYKKKFSESSRNAQKIAAKNKKINEALDEADKMAEPTDEEMKQEFPDWEAMEDYAQNLAKEAIMSKKFREKLTKAREESKKIEKWNVQVDEFVADPETLTKNPDLEGKLEEFKIYASDEVNASIPFAVLVPAFLHNSNIPKKNKGQMFPKGNAGPSDSGKKDNKLTLEEGRQLRVTDYKKWKAYLKAGRIKIDL
jgi:hypothetical protein